MKKKLLFKFKFILVSFLILLSLLIVLFSCVKKVETIKNKKALVNANILNNFSEAILSNLFQDIKIDKNVKYNIDLEINKYNIKTQKEELKNYKIEVLENAKEKNIAVKLKDIKNKKNIYYDGKYIYLKKGENNIKLESLPYLKLLELFVADINSNTRISYKNYYIQQIQFIFVDLLAALIGNNKNKEETTLDAIYNADKTYENQDEIVLTTKKLKMKFLNFLPLDFINEVNNFKKDYKEFYIKSILNKKTGLLEIHFNFKIENKEKDLLVIKVKNINNIILNKDTKESTEEFLKEKDKEKSIAIPIINKYTLKDIEVFDRNNLKKIVKQESLLNINIASILEYFKVINKDTTYRKELNISSHNVTDFSKLDNFFYKSNFKLDEKILIQLEFNPKKYGNDNINIALEENLAKAIILNRKNDLINLNKYKENSENKILNNSDFINYKNNKYLIFQISSDILINNLPNIFVNPKLQSFFSFAYNNKDNALLKILELMELVNNISSFEDNILTINKDDNFKNLLENYPNIDESFVRIFKYLPGNKYILKNILKENRDPYNKINIKTDILDLEDSKKYIYSNPIDIDIVLPKNIKNINDQIMLDLKNKRVEVSINNNLNKIKIEALITQVSKRKYEEIKDKEGKLISIKRSLNFYLILKTNDSIYNLINYLYDKNEDKPSFSYIQKEIEIKQ